MKEADSCLQWNKLVFTNTFTFLFDLFIKRLCYSVYIYGSRLSFIRKQTVVYNKADCCLNKFVCLFFYWICWSEHYTVFILCIGKKIENLLVLLTVDCCWPFKSEAIDLGIQLMIVVKYFPTFAFFALCPFSLPNAACCFSQAKLSRSNPFFLLQCKW